MGGDDIARSIFRDTKLSHDEPVDGGAAEIARRLGLDIYEQPKAANEVCLATWGGRAHIVVREELEPTRANFLVAQMVARYCGAVSDERSVAAWLVAPPAPFEARYHQVGTDLGALAQPFAVTLTAAALRLNEVVGIELAVVGERVIHRRGRRFDWIGDAELRMLAAKRAPRSLRKAVLRRDGAAVALLASA